MTQEYKQMSFLEAFPAKRSVKQDYKRAEVTTDGSGMKCLMLLSKSNKTTWKVKVSKSNVSLFQLQASVLGIKEKESGYWLQTPTTQDARIGPNNIGGNQHRIKRGSIALADQVLFPTPTTMDHIDRKGMRPSRAATNRKTGYLSREQERREVGSEVEGRSTNLSDSKVQGLQRFSDVSSSVSSERETTNFGGEDCNREKTKGARETWWQTQSRVCGVPNGVSYGVDKDRAKRIKALGNSIVPQIVRQLGLAIKEAENE